jgi:tetratricopeptide (TPR) repeat protein
MSCPYRILIGPLFNPDYLGDYQQDPNIRIFKHRNPVEAQPERFHILYDMEKTPTFGHILAQLPPDWEPDVVIWWDAVYQGVPPGIERCPYPTILIVGDWNVGALQSLVHAEMFDALLADRSFLRILERYQFANGLYWPGFSFQPQIHRSLPAARDIDISFVGNLNSSVHLERSVLLDQVLQLRDQYQVVVSQGVWGDAYVELLNRSKIVFNYSVRSEMNMRAYEAPACGALLFMEANNLEVRDFLTDREHCVLYTPENLHELLVYYLSHDEEREAIAAAGQRRIQAYTYHKQFEQLWTLIPTVQTWFHRHARTYGRRSAMERLLLDSRQLFFALSHGSSALARQLITQIPSFTGPLTVEQAEHLNALSVLLTPVLASGAPLSTETDALFTHLYDLFGLCHQAEPQHPVYLYHQGFMLESRQQWEQAESVYLSVLALLEILGAAEKIYHTRFYLLPSPRFRTHNPFPTEWEQACVGLAPGTESHELLARFKAQIWQRIALMRYYLQRWPMALEAYTHLILMADRGLFWLWKARVHVVLGELASALNCFQNALARDPFLIAQIGAVFSGAHFAEIHPVLRPWVIRYADIFPAVKDYLQLMRFFAAPLSERDGILAGHYSARWVQLLISCQYLSEQWLNPLLNQPVRVAIKGLQAPESPNLLPQAPFLQWVEADAEVVFERVWEQGSFATWRLSMAELPCLFAMPSEPQPCEDVGGVPYVLLLPDALPMAVCLAVIMQFETDFATQNIQLVLWSPGFSEQDWEVFIAHIPENYAAQISILSYSLTSGQQQGLFHDALAVLGGPLRYLWWGLWLGTRAALVKSDEQSADLYSWENLKMPVWTPGQFWPHLQAEYAPLTARMQALYRQDYPHKTLAQFWRWALNWRSGKSVQ